MKKTSIRTRTLAPAVVLAVGALVATPAIATTAHDTEPSPTATGTPESETPEPEAPEASETETAEAAEASEPASESSQQEQGTDAAETTQEAEETQAAEDPAANASPSVSFPDYPADEVDRSAGESISIKVGYEAVETGAPITVYVNGEKVEHGAGYESIQKTDRQSGGFWMRLDGAFMDSTQSGTDAARDTVQVRVGEGRSAIQVNEISEDPADISPSVEMDHPLQAQKVADEGIEVRVKTAPNADVDVSKVSVLFAGGYTLEPAGDWNGTADENGDYTFTISPDTEITSTFDPSRNTTVGQLREDDSVVVQISSNGKNTSFATEVEGEAEQPADPTVEFPDHPDNAAERTIGEDFSATVTYTGAAEGDEVRVIVNGNTQTHGEGTYEAPATVTEADGEFQVSLPAEFLDEDRSGTAEDQDVLQVRVGTTRNHIRINEVEAEAEPTVEFPDHPDNTAERTIGEDFSATVTYTGAAEGDEVRVIVNGNTQTHGEGTYEAPATVTETDGEFQVSLPAEFLDEVRSGTADNQDILQVRVGTTRNHIRITEAEADPTDEPTDDPTEDPTDEPTEDPTDEPTDEPTQDPSDDPTDNGDEEQAAPSLSIEPDRISMSDFVDPDRGVTLTVTGLEPGDDVEFGVDPASGQNVDPATLPAVATEEGVASTVVYGVSSADAATYIGDFDVTVDGIDEAEAQTGSEATGAAADAAAEDVVGSFTVLSDEDADDEQDGDRDDDAGGDDDRDGERDDDADDRDDERDGEAGEDDSDNGDDSDSGPDSDDGTDRDGGKDLPRTGGEFGGLAVGGALLAVGAASVIVTRRRMHKS